MSFIRIDLEGSPIVLKPENAPWSQLMDTFQKNYAKIFQFQLNMRIKTTLYVLHGASVLIPPFCFDIFAWILAQSILCMTVHISRKK